MKPYSVNIIPGQTSFTIDFRHTSEEVLSTMLVEVKAEFDNIVAANEADALSLGLRATCIYTGGQL